MPSPKVITRLTPKAVAAGLEAIRTDLGVPEHFSTEVLAAANAAAARTFEPGPDRLDHRDLAFITIDPDGSTDLDQAFHAVSRSDGFTVHYAIADVAAFVEAGGPLDLESLERGVTMYSPDSRAPLYPPQLSEGAASLLPDVDRPALVWTIDLDRDGTLGHATLERALVRSRAKLTYDEAQTQIDEGSEDPVLSALRAIGEARLRQERERGAVSLALPDQEVDAVNGGYELQFRTTLPVERWNAQISLLTGIAAAHIMVRGGQGILRTLPPPQAETVATLRRAARTLRIKWPRAMGYAERVRTLDPSNYREAALMHQASRLFRGAGYEAFDHAAHSGEPAPGIAEHRASEHRASEHSAIASIYAHVTAPLRRVGDRFANEILLAQCAGRPAPAWALERLAELPSILGRARQRQGALDRAAVDFVETLILADKVGDRFQAGVIDRNKQRAIIEIKDPAIIAEVEPASLKLGSEITVELTHADPATRTLVFAHIDAASRTHR